MRGAIKSRPGYSKERSKALFEIITERANGRSDPSGVALLASQALAAGADPDTQWHPDGRDHSDRFSALMGALLLASDTGIARALLKAGANPVSAVSRSTPLILALEVGDTALAQELIAAGFPVDFKAEGQTALMHFSHSRDAQACAFLIGAGADPELPSSHAGQWDESRQRSASQIERATPLKDECAQVFKAIREAQALRAATKTPAAQAPRAAAPRSL